MWSINVSSISNYKNLTANNFYIISKKIGVHCATNLLHYADNILDTYLSYDASNGILYINNWASIVGDSAWTVYGAIENVDLYYVG